MRKLILTSVLFLLFFAFGGGGTADAQKKLRLNSTPKVFQTFYAKFRNAANKGDKKTIVSVTRFPFKYGFDAGDEGTFTKAQFVEKFDVFFDAESDIFAQKNPEFYQEAGTFNLTDESNASHYIFEKKGAGYKFTAFIVEP